jgi:hypothetical protein
MSNESDVRELIEKVSKELLVGECREERDNLIKKGNKGIAFNSVINPLGYVILSLLIYSNKLQTQAVQDGQDKALLVMNAAINDKYVTKQQFEEQMKDFGKVSDKLTTAIDELRKAVWSKQPLETP